MCLETIISVVIIELSFLSIWYLINKVRNSKNKVIREFDNGYEFYSSLSDKDKDEYWREDTKIVNQFFLIIFIFIHITLLLCVFLSFEMIYICLLVISFIILLVVFIRKSLALQRKYKNK